MKRSQRVASTASDKIAPSVSPPEPAIDRTRLKYYFKCPNCKNDEHFSLPSCASTGLGCLLLILGGFIPALLYAESTRRRVQCSSCGFIFRQPSLPRTPVSDFTTWILGIVLLFGLLTVVLILFPALTALVPDAPLVLNMETFIKNNPKAIGVGLAPIIPLILIVSLLTSWGSNRRAHKLLKTKFKIEPGPFSRKEE